MCFVKHLSLTLSVGLPAKINYPVPATQQVRFQLLRVTERFCIESGNLSRVIVGHPSNDLVFCIDRTFRASISSFSTLRKLIYLIRIQLLSFKFSVVFPLHAHHILPGTFSGVIAILKQQKFMLMIYHVVVYHG